MPEVSARTRPRLGQDTPPAWHASLSRGRGRPAEPVDAAPPGLQQAPLILRAALLTVVGLLAGLHGQLGSALPWVAALGVVVVASSRARPREFEAALITVEVTLAAASTLETGGGTSPLLAYLPAAALIAGWTYGSRGALATVGWECVVLGVGHLLVAPDRGLALADVSATLPFTFLALVVGLLAAWTRGRDEVAHEMQQYAAVNRLLSRVREAKEGLPTTLDAGTVADVLLDRLERQAPAERSAVLVRVGTSQLAPLSCHGIRRVPWRDPALESGPLRTCLETEQPVLNVRTRDANGRRAGGALVVLPLRVTGRVLGLAVLETSDSSAPSPAVVQELARVADANALALDTALLFDELRATASLEERERLARDIHDGVAQDLAFLGYEIDSLRRKLPTDAAAHGQAVRLRSALNELVGDLRVSITDLRTSVRGERGLAAALTSYVRTLGSRAGWSVHLSLAESNYRLPADVEVQLFRIAQEILGHVRRVPAANLWVQLAVDPPAGRLVLEHDAAAPDPDLDHQLLTARARDIGASLQVTGRPDGGSRFVIELGAEAS